jgi:hypothetical protein
LLALAAPGPAIADDPPRPTDIPAVSAYIELVPTSRGPKQAGAGTARGRPLGARIERLVRTQGGEDAALLERLATSPAYGAPSSPTPKTPASKIEPKESRPTSSGNALSAAIDAGGEGGARRLLVLLVLLTAVTAIIGVVAARRRRAPTSP